MTAISRLPELRPLPSRHALPRLMLAAMAGLAAIAMALAGTARTTGIGATRLDLPTGGASVDLRFEDGPAGTIRVIDVAGARAPQIVHPGQDGFVRVAMRSLARDRRVAGAGPETPFRLGRLDDGRLWLRDLATGRLLYLDAYGYGNARSFARLLDQQFSPPSRSKE